MGAYHPRQPAWVSDVPTLCRVQSGSKGVNDFAGDVELDATCPAPTTLEWLWERIGATAQVTACKRAAPPTQNLPQNGPASASRAAHRFDIHRSISGARASERERTARPGEGCPRQGPTPPPRGSLSVGVDRSRFSRFTVRYLNASSACPIDNPLALTSSARTAPSSALGIELGGSRHRASRRLPAPLRVREARYHVFG